MRNIVLEATLIDGCAVMHSILHWPKGKDHISRKFCPSQIFISYLTDTKIIVLNQIQDKKIISIPTITYAKFVKSTSSKRDSHESEK